MTISIWTTGVAARDFNADVTSDLLLETAQPWGPGSSRTALWPEGLPPVCSPRDGASWRPATSTAMNRTTCCCRMKALWVCGSSRMGHDRWRQSGHPAGRLERRRHRRFQCRRLQRSAAAKLCDAWGLVSAERGLRPRCQYQGPAQWLERCHDRGFKRRWHQRPAASQWRYPRGLAHPQPPHGLWRKHRGSCRVVGM